MKQLYLRLFSGALPLFFLLFVHQSSAQTCADGSPQQGTSFDTTIRVASGVVNTSVKFPKFNPGNGRMVTCVNLCITIKGIIDTTAVENYETSSNTYSYTYTRKDTITGPGIPTFLNSNANIVSPTYPLSPTNGVPGSGPDFYSHGPDTILTRVICSNISDSASIVQFYGVNDSVTYNYKVDASLSAAFSGASVSQFILSSALVNFHFSYCSCPALSLPLSIDKFNLKKLLKQKRN
ncbi:MAG: choice-of-anchor E domain-containing protein [Chitinophagaceae bacterium]